MEYPQKGQNGHVFGTRKGITPGFGTFRAPNVRPKSAQNVTFWYFRRCKKTPKQGAPFPSGSTPVCTPPEALPYGVDVDTRGSGDTGVPGEGAEVLRKRTQ